MLNAHFDEIRSKLDRLNALSDSINSLERQFDEANSIFRETLKCSTDRLSTIARTLGSKSIRHGRAYHGAKLTVEQNQSECQRACVEFEQANKEHQFAKKAILDAEQRLKETARTINGQNNNSISEYFIESSLDLNRLRLTDETDDNIGDPQIVPCDEDIASTSSLQTPSTDTSSSSSFSTFPDSSSTSKPDAPMSTVMLNNDTTTQEPSDATSKDSTDGQHETLSVRDRSIEKEAEAGAHQVTTNQIVSNAAKLSEQLNKAIMRLDEAERRREQSEKQHFDCTNRLMVAKENLVRLEREHGQSIRRSQTYFDEAKQFNAKLDSVKSNICRISKDILAAKKAYAQTLSDLEQFSEDLHENSAEQAQ